MLLKLLSILFVVCALRVPIWLHVEESLGIELLSVPPSDAVSSVFWVSLQERMDNVVAAFGLAKNSHAEGGELVENA